MAHGKKRQEIIQVHDLAPELVTTQCVVVFSFASIYPLVSHSDLTTSLSSG